MVIITEERLKLPNKDQRGLPQVEDGEGGIDLT